MFLTWISSSQFKRNMDIWRFIMTIALVFPSVIGRDANDKDMSRTKCPINRQQKSVNCSHQDLSEVPNSTFAPDTREIYLDSNYITTVENGTFTGVSQLRILDLSDNEIRFLEPMAFEDLETLVCLNLSRNAFKLLPEIFSPTLFGPLKRLETLRIQVYAATTSSEWKGVDRGFSVLRDLQELFMDFPADFAFEDGFAELTNLETLSTAGRSRNAKFVCPIGKLTNDTFVTFAKISIKELRLIDCGITAVEIGTFLPLYKLSILDLSNNNRLGLGNALKALYGLQHRNMEEINFSIMNWIILDPKNFMLHESDTIYLKTICVKYLDMSENYIFYAGDNQQAPSFGRPDCLKILKIFAHAMRYFPGKLFSDFLWFGKYTSIKYIDVSGSFNAPVHTAVDITANPKFENSQTLGVTQSIINERSEALSSAVPIALNPLPSLETINISNIINWAYLNSDIEFDNSTILRTLNLSYNNLDNCERHIKGFEHLTDLDISGVLCGHLNRFLTDFSGLQKLAITNTPNLYMDIGDPEGASDSFQTLWDLRELDLSGNKLTNLNDKLFISTTALRSISLSNNKLQRVPSAIMHLKNISRLDLSINAFTHLTVEEISLFERFSAAQHGHSRFRLSLGRNPFQCTCKTLEFIRWIYSTDILLDLDGNYTCFLSNGSRVDFIGFKSDLKTLSVSCISHTWLIIGVFCISFALVFIFLVYLVYRYRTNIRYWFYSQLKPPSEFLEQEEYVYDAFVAYSEENYEWVIDNLHTVLEVGDKPLKLCIHKRDFTPGKPIHENIVDKMRQSRKIILVISAGFLESHFGPTEIMYAGMKSLEVGRDDIIVCILLEEIPIQKMPKALRNFWHTMTFLKWSDDPREQCHFSQQLKDAVISK